MSLEDLELFYDHFFDCYDKLIFESSNTSFIVAGDFNPATNRFQPKYIGKQCHLKQIVKGPTRGANILDLIFTNIREFYESPKILAPIATCDHSTIVWNSKSWQPKKNGTRKLRVKPLRPGAVLVFGEFLEKCNWSSLLSIIDVNNKVDAFLKFTHDSIDSFFPTKTVKIHEEDKPFITGKIKKLISKQNKAYKSGNTALYKRLRNQIVSDVRIAKKNFYHDHVRPAFCKDQHVWWKISIKSLGKRNRLLH